MKKYGRCYNFLFANGNLPSVYEWEFLFRKIGDDAAALKSKKGWKNSRKGRDDYGFSALPAGAGLKCNLERIEASLEKLRLFDIAERKRLNEEKDECEKNPYQFDAGKEAVFWTSSSSGAYNDVKAVFFRKDVSTGDWDINNVAPIRCIYGNSRY